MAVAVVPVAQCSPEQMSDLFLDASWPAFIDADREAARSLPRVRAAFCADELALVEDERVVVAGWGVPLVWNGRLADLPGGYTSSLDRALDDLDNARVPNTFVVCAIQVHGRATGRSLASTMITALADHARHHGLPQVIAPLRPTRKHRYPLTPIDRYATWVRDDGQPLDPWLRTHRRLGARCSPPRRTRRRSPAR